MPAVSEAVFERGQYPMGANRVFDTLLVSDIG